MACTAVLMFVSRHPAISSACRWALISASQMELVCSIYYTVGAIEFELTTDADVQVGMYRGEHPQIPMIQICVKQLNVRGMNQFFGISGQDIAADCPRNIQIYDQLL